MYMIYAGSTGYHHPKRERQISQLVDARLFSYFEHIYKYKNLGEFLEMKRKKKNPQHRVNLFLDSGAFSAKEQKVEINLDEYIAFIKKHEKYIKVYANLDVIGDAEATLQNQKKMEKAGLNPLPTYHVGEDISYLEYYIDNYDYMAFGGMARNSIKDRIAWLDRVFPMTCDESGMPKIKVHGFGMTSLKVMLRFPWYCMTEEDHEVLTKSGWKSRDQISIGEDVLCFDKGTTQWEPILDIPTFPVIDADIVSMQNRNFNANVSHNHNWIVKNKGLKNNDWEFRNTDNLRIFDCIPRVGSDYAFPTKKEYTNEQVELLAWFWTDGSIKQRPNCKKDSINIYQSQKTNPDKCKLIENALVNSKEKWCKSISKKDEMVSFELYGHMRDFLLKIAPDKKLPLSFIYKLTKKQLTTFLAYCMQADGTDTGLKRIKGKSICITKEVKKENLEVMRIGYLLLGVPTSIQYNKNYKALVISSVDSVYPGSLQTKEQKYTGNLWCLQVPSKAFFVRSKDKIYVTGNSVDSTSWVTTGRMGGLLVPVKTNGEYDYAQNPHKLDVSAKSPSTKIQGKHLFNLSDAQRQYFIDYLTERGYKLGSSTFKIENKKTYKLKKDERWFTKGEIKAAGLIEPKEKKTGKTGKTGNKTIKKDKSTTHDVLVEKVIEHGVCNDYKLRDELNIMYFLDLEKYMPRWPWRYKAKSSIKGFF